MSLRFWGARCALCQWEQMKSSLTIPVIWKPDFGIPQNNYPGLAVSSLDIVERLELTHAAGSVRQEDATCQAWNILRGSV